MSIIIKTAVQLQKGARLLYCPPENLVVRGRNEIALFEHYDEIPVGPLDHLGRMPGNYVDPRSVSVRFGKEKEVQEHLNIEHFVLLDEEPSRAKIVTKHVAHERLRALVIEPSFYPGDTVKVTGKKDIPEVPRLIGDVFLKEPFTKAGVPRYAAHETNEEQRERVEKTRQSGNFISSVSASISPNFWNVTESELALIARGNVFNLYHNLELVFDSDADELRFWVQTGISKLKSYDAENAVSAYQKFLLEEIDLIDLSSAGPHAFRTFQLHPCFEGHRNRARALTEKLWAEKATAKTA